MHRSVSLLATAAVLLLAACAERDPRDPGAAADAAWDEFRSARDTSGYESFIAANRTAAAAHARPHDARGVELQMRGIEAQARHAAAVGDPHLAGDSLARVRDLEERGHVDLYEELVPGARERLEAAAALAETVLR